MPGWGIVSFFLSERQLCAVPAPSLSYEAVWVRGEEQCEVHSPPRQKWILTDQQRYAFCKKTDYLVGCHLSVARSVFRVSKLSWDTTVQGPTPDEDQLEAKRSWLCILWLKKMLPWIRCLENLWSLLVPGGLNLGSTIAPCLDKQLTKNMSHTDVE